MKCNTPTLLVREQKTTFSIKNTRCSFSLSQDIPTISTLVPFTTWLLRQERTSFTIYCRALQREFVPYTFEGDIPETFYDESVEKEYGFIDIVRK